MAYADTDELARVLKIRNPTTEQEEALQSVLDAAAGEIDAEINLAEDADPLDEDWQLALLKTVNIDRAGEHWKQRESQFGLIGLGTEFGGGAERIARDSWDRHAHKLAPLKAQWGIA